MPNLRTTCVAPASADAAIGYQRKTAEPPSFIEPLRQDNKMIPAMIIKVATTIGNVTRGFWSSATRGQSHVRGFGTG